MKIKAKLKLFIWTGFSPDYTDGLAFAIAENEDEAKTLVEKFFGFNRITQWGDLEILPLTRRVGRCVFGGG